MKTVIIACGVLSVLFSLSAKDIQAQGWWPSEAVSWSRLGNSPYDDPLAVLGKPTVWMKSSGAPNDPDPSAASLVLGAWNVGWPNNEKLVTTIRSATPTLTAGQITVRFNSPIYNDENNWYGKDFIVFGNAFFSAGGSPVYSDSNMEEIVLSSVSGGSGWWEPSPVSVSQDGEHWFTFMDGPFADDFAPTQALAWDWIENGWLKNANGNYVEMDFTKPVDPAYGNPDFAGLTAADAIDLYKGSGGGTAFDIGTLPLPVDPLTGKKWIRYIRVDGTNGEVDAFARVSQAQPVLSIGEARNMADGTRVSLRDVVVSAPAYKTGRFCYVQHPDWSGGIRVMGRVLEEGVSYSLHGVMDTIDGERALLATSALPAADSRSTLITMGCRPLGISIKNLAGPGLSPDGLLVRTTGRVESADAADGSFVVSGGKGLKLKVQPPKLVPSELETPNPTNPNWGVQPAPDYTPPAVGDFVELTGIYCGKDSNGFPILRLRDNPVVHE